MNPQIEIPDYTHEEEWAKSKWVQNDSFLYNYLKKDVMGPHCLLPTSRWPQNQSFKRFTHLGVEISLILAKRLLNFDQNHSALILMLFPFLPTYKYGQIKLPFDLFMKQNEHFSN